MNREEARQKIDEIDRELVALFARRMLVSEEIGKWKKENGFPVMDEAREQAKMQALLEQCPESARPYLSRLYGVIFELSRDCQQKIVTEPEEGGNA